MRPFLHPEFACVLGLSPRPWGCLLCSGRGHRSVLAICPIKERSLARIAQIGSAPTHLAGAFVGFYPPTFLPRNLTTPESRSRTKSLSKTLDWSCPVCQEASIDLRSETNRWIVCHLVANSEHGRVGVPELRGISWKGRWGWGDFILSDVLRFPCHSEGSSANP